LSTPRYLHVPLVLNAAGEKLSKQSGATAIDTERPIQELQRAGLHLGLGTIQAGSVDAFLRQAGELWRDKQRAR
jgi:glutamyl-Q tRNA(Asp) synthetase